MRDSAPFVDSTICGIRVKAHPNAKRVLHSVTLNDSRGEGVTISGSLDMVTGNLKRKNELTGSTSFLGLRSPNQRAQANERSTPVEPAAAEGRNGA